MASDDCSDIELTVPRTVQTDAGARLLTPGTPAAPDRDTGAIDSASEPPTSREEARVFLEPGPDDDNSGDDAAPTDAPGPWRWCPCIQKPESRDAWLAAVAGMIITTCVASEMAAFGIYYVGYSELFGVSKAAAGWIKGLQTLSGAFFSIPASTCIKVYGARLMVIGAGFCMFGGMFLGSFSPNIYVSFLTHGMLLGIGSSIANMSVAVCIQQHFTRNKVTGAGISNFGYTLGGFSFPIIASLFMEKYGLRGSLVIHSAILANVVPLGTLLKSPIPKRPQNAQIPDSSKKPKVTIARQIKAELLDVSLLKNPLFVTFLVAGFLIYYNISMFLSHLVGRAMFYGYSRSQAAYLQSSTSVASCCARILATFLANMKSVNKALVYGVGLVIASMATVLYGLFHSYVPWLVTTILYGLGLGAANTVSYVMCVQFFSLGQLPKVMGFFTLASYLGLSVGPPLSGLIFDETSDYDLPFYLAGALSAAGATMVLIIAFVDHRKRHHKTREDAQSLNSKSMCTMCNK